MTMKSPDGVQASAVDYDPFAGEAIARVVPTTEPQREVWLADRLSREASLAFNESVTLRLRGALDPGALALAVQDLVDRHDALRSTFSADGQSLTILAALPVAMATVDHRGRGTPASLEEERRRVVREPFDLEQGPLFRAELHRIADDDHALLVTAHHIVCDGWSFGILVPDLAKLYAGRLGQSAGLSEGAESFGDYAGEQAAARGAEALRAAEAFWVARFADGVPVLDLPVDRPRPALRDLASQRVDHVIEPEVVQRLRKLGAGAGATLFSTLAAGFAALLQRIGGNPDVVIGVPAAGQSLGHEGLVGHCVNLLPMRIDADPAAAVPQYVRAVQSAVLDAFENQTCTYGSLLQKLAIPRDASRLPLVNVMFNLDQTLDANAAGFPGLAAELCSNARAFENFELFVNCVQADGALRMECQYSTALFEEATVRQWLACYEALLRSACDSPSCAVDRLDVLPPGDRARLDAWNATAVPFSRDALVHELFERQAAREPARPALRFGDRRLSYGELDELANRLARALRARGAKRGMRVGIHVRRGVDMLASVLAVLKSGAAYVPLDPAYPRDRLGFMAADAQLGLLVTESALADAIDYPAERIFRLDAESAHWKSLDGSALARDDASARPDSIAYAIYTSGSTGKPKGVLVPHRCVVNFIESMAREPGLAAGDRVAAVTTLSFDIAVNELLAPLAVGAEVIMASPEESSDGTLLARLLEAGGATVLQATPATWRLLLQAGWRGSRELRAFCGGEALAPDLARELLARTRELWNLYGPTETTVWSTCRRITGDGAAIDIGRPIANTSVWILDESRAPCPVGIPGEIWIGGAGVTAGYHDRPELTAERFVADPFANDPLARIYRTGDRGRWRSDGHLEHLGRLDHQVKVRGYRIELGEIESALAASPAVGQAVAIVREDRAGDQRLVAYVTASGGELPAEEALKALARRTLPEYMVPHHVVVLPRVPLLPNGKVDRKSLPAPQVAGGREFVPPRNDVERTVAAEMEAALGMPGVSLDDDFFALGGHSLLAAQLTARLNRVFGTQLTMRSLFAAPTIARLARLVEEGSGAPPAATRTSVTPLARRDVAPLSVMQERLKFLEDLYPGRVNYNAPSAHRLLGSLDTEAFERAFREMMRRQPVLRTRIDTQDGVAVQRIDEHVPFALFPAEDLSSLPAGEREEALARRLEALTAETFDLARAPLFKARMFRLGPVEHVLFFMPHHIIWDGWSFDLLYEELATLYGAFVARRPSPLADLRVTYGDFCAWHRDWMQGAEFRGQVEFWRSRLAAQREVRELPTDRPRRPGMSGAGNTLWISIDKPLAEALHGIARKQGTTVFILLLAAYGVLLQAWSGQRSLVVGTPVRGRNALDLEGIMGFFNNLLPLRIDLEPHERFADVVARVRDVVVDCFASPDVPMEELASELTSAGPAASLYQALFSFQDARQRTTRWGELSHSVIPLFQKGATEDLGLWFVETPGGMHGGITYNTELFDEGTAGELHRGFLALLAAIVADPEAPVLALTGPSGARIALKTGPAALAMPPASVTVRAAPLSRPPATATEQLLAQIWREQLKLAEVGLDDNFFDLGGHSLLAMQAIVAMETKTGRQIDRARYIFETLGQIAAAYDSAPAPAPAKPGGLRGLFSSLVGGRKD